MSLQLTLARVAAEDAERRWKAHKGDCPKCSEAQHRRATTEMCASGRILYDDRQDTAAELAQERRLDRLPIPGQLTFDEIAEEDEKPGNDENRRADGTSDYGTGPWKPVKRKIRVGSLCSGVGGIELGLKMILDHELAFVADVGSGASKVLECRFPQVPNLHDLREIDWSLVEPVDIITAGFSCQDVSHAGGRDGLAANNRSGVWYQCVRAIDALRPEFVIIENVRGLLSARADCNVESCPWCMGGKRNKYPLRALGAVLASLADIGFDAEWTTLSAASVGAPHKRERVFILAWPAPEDADGATGSERRQSAPGQAACWWPWTDTGRRSGALAANADGNGSASCVAGSVAASRPEAEGGGPSTDAGGGGNPADGAWGAYEPAIRRWEPVIGQPAPAPTRPGRSGVPRLNVSFVQWAMGFPEGWVTAVPNLSHGAQLLALGNSCMPQQAAKALAVLFSRTGLREKARDERTARERL